MRSDQALSYSCTRYYQSCRIHALENISAERCCLSRSHTTLYAEGRAGCQKGHLSLNSLGNPTIQQVPGLIAKHEVETGSVCTKSPVLRRDLTVTADVLINLGEQCDGTVTVSETLLDTVGESSAWLVEI